MKILAIDTSGPCASAAVYAQAHVVSQCAVEDARTHSETIISLIDFALIHAHVARSELDAVAVSNGPGSFTGLRIGVAIAKAMGQALQIPCIGVSTLDVLCYQAQGAPIACAVMDARRKEVYSAAYRGKSCIVPHAPRPLDELLAQLQPYAERVAFCGDGVRVYRAQIEQALGERAAFAPAPYDVQLAGSVAMLAAQMPEAAYDDAFSLLPNYLRLSQAERERLERGGQSRG